MQNSGVREGSSLPPPIHLPNRDQESSGRILDVMLPKEIVRLHPEAMHLADLTQLTSLILKLRSQEIAGAPYLGSPGRWYLGSGYRERLTCSGPCSGVTYIG